MAHAEIIRDHSQRRTRLDKAAKVLLKHVCKRLMSDCNDPMTIQSLLKVVKVKDEQHLVSFLEEYPSLFEITSYSTDQKLLWTVQPKTDVQLCAEHTENAGSCTTYSCDKLHICKFYLSGKDGCKRPDIGTKKCRFLHDLKSAHNLPILQEMLLDELSAEEIQLVFRLTRPSQTPSTKDAIPITCKFYNSSGCEKSSCLYLHLCCHFILGNCKFQTSCKRSHDLYAPQPRAILRKCGLDPHQTKASKILQILQKKLMEAGLETTHKASSVPVRQSVGGARPKLNKLGMPLHSPRPETVMHSAMSQVEGSNQPEICSHFLKGKCRFASSCFNCHPSSNLPHQWQVTSSLSFEDVWKDVEQTVDSSLEAAYCDPNQWSYKFCFEGVFYVVEFDTLTLQVGQSNSKIRRLSTPSSEEEGQEFNGLATEWAWFWEDMDKSWKQYGSQGFHSSKANVSSADLEKKYLNQPRDELRFATNSYEYVMDFAKMEQRNAVLGTKRKVRRRPVLVTVQTLPEKLKRAAEKMKEQTSLSDIVPASWKSQSPSLDTFCKVEVDRTGSTAEEFMEIENLVLKSMQAEGDSLTRVKAIFRIQNLELLERFESKKRWMMRKSSSPGSSLERRLYHGTRQCYMDAICQQGFDFRVSGLSTGTKFGKGSYFSVSAKYSSRYSDTDEVFVARVLTGDFTRGDASYTRPPLKPQTSQLFDSCVDRINSPTMFIVFDLAQAYPEYIVQLKQDSCLI
ncbi:protein mono-ADP-ribosyltransferase PARP12-like [Liolophura sinensis]|uniref:protein mono-ADP-ribosyltransferase PARP12-like n=1 Tax=Liolophura sinensis TaxID=3198878 RepID=UPI0031580E18